MAKIYAFFAASCLVAAAGCTANVEDPNVNQQGRGGNTCVTDCDNSQTTCVAKCTDDACKVSCKTTHDMCVGSCPK